jgi:hypothetical protein
MSKPIHEPKIWYMKELYQDYAAKLLGAHPEWWGKYEKRIKMRNCYVYAHEGNKVVEKMSWFLWKEIIERYYFKAKDAIIQGEVLRLGSSLGKIRAIRVERDYRKPAVNWHATYQHNPKKPKTETVTDEPKPKLQLIYHQDEDWCRIAWEKLDMLKNENAYQFSPAEKNMATGKGFKAEFSDALKKNPLLKYRYKFHPLVNKIVRMQTYQRQPVNLPAA